MPGLRSDHDLEAGAGRVGNGGDGFRSLGERIRFGDQFPQKPPFPEAKPRRSGLQADVGGVAAEDGFLIHANGPQIQSGHPAPHGMAKDEDPPGSAHEGVGLLDGRIDGDSDNGSVDGAIT